jgi:hypothetical protein
MVHNTHYTQMQKLCMFAHIYVYICVVKTLSFNNNRNAKNASCLRPNTLSRTKCQAVWDQLYSVRLSVHIEYFYELYIMEIISVNVSLNKNILHQQSCIKETRDQLKNFVIQVRRRIKRIIQSISWRHNIVRLYLEKGGGGTYQLPYKKTTETPHQKR